MSTPFGTRLMVGDVVGSGGPALDCASTIYTGWHELARCESSLTGIAVRLHSLIAISLRAEEFVTALMVNVPVSGPAEFVSCGHPPPLLIRGESVTFAAMPSPAPPLGLLDLAAGWCSPAILPFSAGDRMILYTDGVTEARDDNGRFYPLLDRVRAFSSDDPGRMAAALEADVIEHAGGRMSDDAALLVVHHD